MKLRPINYDCATNNTFNTLYLLFYSFRLPIDVFRKTIQSVCPFVINEYKQYIHIHLKTFILIKLIKKDPVAYVSPHILLENLVSYCKLICFEKS